MFRTLPGRILQDVVGEILHLWQTELLTLVDVGATRKGEFEHDGRAGATTSQSNIGRCAVERGMGSSGIREVQTRDLLAVAGDGAEVVVVAQHPGGTCAH